MDGTPSRPFQIVVVDDEPDVQRGLRLRLGTEPDLQVVGGAATGSEAVDLVQRLRPDLVLMDGRLPGTDGFAATVLLRQAHPHLPVVMLSLYDDAASRRLARQAGAVAFVAKHEGDRALLQAIRRHLSPPSSTREPEETP